MTSGPPVIAMRGASVGYDERPAVRGVELFGVPAGRFKERYRIGYVPQRHTVGGAIPSTVEEVVASGRLPRKRRPSRVSGADRAAVTAAIEAVDLTPRRKAAVSTLS